MDVVAPDPLRLDARDLVVRERVGGHLALAAIFVTLSLGWTVGPWLLAGSGLWVRGAISVGLGLPLLWISSTLARGALRGLRRDRWTLRVGAECLWLSPRSFLNEARGRAPTPWLRIPLERVSGVRPGELRAHMPDGEGGRMSVTERWIDLDLVRPAPADLRRVVDEERSERSGTRFLAYPLEWRGERTLRVYWQTSGLALAPRREHVLEALGRRVPVHAGGRTPVVAADELEPADVDALARDLHARGRVLDAVRLLRARRGWSLGHARAWLRDADAA